jgi:uncharacterized membrane protein
MTRLRYLRSTVVVAFAPWALAAACSVVDKSGYSFVDAETGGSGGDDGGQDAGAGGDGGDGGGAGSGGGPPLSCSDELCENGGICTEEAAGFSCDCEPGFSGERCERAVSDCDDEPCLNDGRCVDVGDGYVCDCLDGYSGDNCQSNPDDCVGNLCENGADCVDGLAEYECDCAPGYEGDLCADNIDECSPNPCRNGGTCTDAIADFDCACIDDWGGPTCEIKLFEPIGFLAGSTESRANAISGDGSVAVGVSPDAADVDRPFVWGDGVMTALPDGNNLARAAAVNFDGSVIAGSTNDGSLLTGAFWLDPFENITPTYAIDSTGASNLFAVSANSTTLTGVIVGSCRANSATKACRWVNLDDDPNLVPATPPYDDDIIVTIATDVSADGSIIVGRTMDPFRAFRWSASAGWQTLAALAGHSVSQATVISDDGSIVYGFSMFNDGVTEQDPVRWVDGSLEAEPLGFGTEVFATNSDGSVLVVDRTLIWDEENGLRQMSTVLEDLGVDLAGWDSVVLTGVSADGKTFSGYGDRDSTTEAIVVRLP